MISTTPIVTPHKNFLATVRSYILLTKPRIIELLLITTVPPMIVAERLLGEGGLPSIGLILVTLIGGTLAAGSANTFNCVIDRDIDAKMQRTCDRPLPAQEISVTGAVCFGILLQIFSFVLLGLTVNLLSAGLAAAATFYYIFIYTIALKRSTVQNIVIGGAAGAMPVLVGWAAVTGSVTSLEDIPAWAMFALVFYWTPPHFWALAIKYREDYERAGVPMLPVVQGLQETARQILRYALIMGAISLLLGAVGRMGLLYFIPAIVCGVVFVKLAFELYKNVDTKKAMQIFFFSIAYLGILFIAMALDAFVAGAV